MGFWGVVGGGGGGGGEVVPKLFLWRIDASVRAPGRPTELSVWRMKESSYYWKAVYLVLVTHGWTWFLQVQVLLWYFYTELESRYTDAVVVVLGLGLVVPRVYG